jgi:hypothetical protein
VGAALAALVLAGCGAARQYTGASTPAASGSAGGGSAAALPPGPDVPSDAQVAPDELVISVPGNDGGAAQRAVEEAGGEVVDTDDRIGVLVARFPVDDVDALLEVRDALRADGVDAAVNPVIRNPGGG